MNILPKKRWHVRTKENIARVRRDEALAAEQAKIEQARIDKAESEARLNFLRSESRKKDSNDIQQTPKDVPESNCSTSTTSKHINFFEELEQGNIDFNRSNKDYEKEKKEEQEKYEKQIGYLTYLGQGVKEAVSSSWYNELPKRIDDTEKNIEFKPNKKSIEDPMQDIKRYLKMMSCKKSNKPVVKCEDVKPSSSNIMKSSYSKNNKRKRESSTESKSSEDDHRSKKKLKKHKKHKHKSKKHKKNKEKESSKSSSSLDIEKLRAERLEREEQERLKTQALLAELKSKGDLNDAKPFKQKYNSQFFPELARQNCEQNYKRI